VNKDDLNDKANAIAKTIDELAQAMKLAAFASASNPAVSRHVMVELARASISLDDAAEYVRAAIEELT
jgi:hypothetical protein